MEVKVNYMLSGSIRHEIENPEALEYIENGISKFNNLDYGKVPQEDAEANNADLRAWDGRLLARYDGPRGTDLYFIGYPRQEDKKENWIDVFIMYVSDY